VVTGLGAVTSGLQLLGCPPTFWHSRHLIVDPESPVIV
jgi:hypothetical protein